MRVAWCPCLGKQGNRLHDFSKNGIIGITSTNYAWVDGYPGTTIEIGNSGQLSEAVQNSSGVGYCDFSNGFIVEVFFYNHFDPGNTTRNIFGAAFGASDAVTMTINNNSRTLNFTSGGQATTLTMPTGHTFPNQPAHVIYVQPRRPVGDTVSGLVGCALHQTGAVIVGTGRAQTASADTPSAFTQITMGNRKTLGVGYPARYSFCLAYSPGQSTASAVYDSRWVLKRLSDPFGIFGLDKRKIGKAPAAAAASPYLRMLMGVGL